jgi:perosamine synthetase
VKAFERAFAAKFGVPHARAVTSGTAAIHAAVAAIDPEPGDEIITTAITDMGAIAPILYQQAIPIFADVDPVSLNVTPETVAARITPRTRAVIATHLFGSPCDVVGIKRIADAKGIPVIEDCAQAFLATQRGRLVGTIGAIGVFSLQQGKHMTTGEGGIVITSQPAYARWMTLFSDKAWGYGDPKPDHYFLALNYRMTDLQGAVARAQLEKLDGVVTRRERSAWQLSELLSDLPGLTLPAPLPNATHVYWKYPLIVDPEVIQGGADALGAALKARGVFCAPRYIQKPAFQCQVLAEQKTYGKSRCPFSCRAREDGREIIYDAAEYPGTMQGLERVVVLPWSEFYTDEHVSFIAEVVRNAALDLTTNGRHSRT